MSGLWRRRAVRHLAIGIAPLLLVGAVLIVVLAIRFAEVARPARQATAQTQATVVRSGLGADGRTVELRWTDSSGAGHVSRVRVPEVANVRTGATVTLRYPPSDPSQVYLGGDETTVRLRNIAYGVFLTALILLTAVGITVLHVIRRLRVERAPGATVPATYARSKRGLLQRSWLVLPDKGREWWVPVHWEPALVTLLANAPCPVHGRPSLDRVLVVDVAGTPVWQSGRKRPASPAGEIVFATMPRSTSAASRSAGERRPDGRLVRQFRGDAALLVVAPLLGLLWAYVDGSGTAGFAGATAVLAGVLFWLPGLLGTDPT